jgi:molybdopterin molybdotransferase
MITVEEAKKLIEDNVLPLAIIELDVVDALDYFLAEDIVAPISIPSFNQSAMDGYAFCFEDINQSIKVVDEVAAGDTGAVKSEKGSAVRIFTGAKVPTNYDTVVMQELTEVNNNKLTVKDGGLKLGGNIRLKGSQINTGDNALEKGTKITAATIGFVSALGYTKVKVYQSPKVAIIATGNELVKPGNELKEGQIYESNTFMLQAALNKLGIKPSITVVEDNQLATEKAIEVAISANEMVLLSGGISVGDYDFVKESLENLGVEDVFYKVKQKPGKPLFFGKTNSCYVFGLPGNPAAALSCFYQYANSAVNLMKGNKDAFLKKVNLPLTKELKKKEGRSVFYKGFTDFKTVDVLEGQGSDMLKSFALANCLVYIPAEKTSIAQNEIVEVHLLS